MTEKAEVLLAREGHVLTCTLNRETRRNALSASAAQAMIDALKEADADPEVRVVCLTGAGDRAFCSGGDLASDIGGAGVEGAIQTFIDLVLTMEGLGTPLLARVNGHCMAGGMGLMLGCDIAVAVDDAKFGTPEVRSGLFPMVISPIIERHVGPKKSREMLFTGRRYTAAQAVEMGLVNKAVPRDQLDEEVRNVVEELLAGAPVALSIGRKALNHATHHPLADVADRLAEELTKVISTEDAMEGISAFLEKRQPAWKGR